MAVKCPYNELELKIALMGLSSVDLDEAKVKAMGEKYELSLEKKTINKHIAEDNGIDIPTLISSPNYALLLTEYMQTLVNKMISEMQKEFGLTNIEAWGILAAITNSIKD